MSFNDDVRPILADRCYACHGPDSAARKADLRLDLEETAKAPIGEGGVIPIVPGKPEASAILQRLTSHDPDEVMPPPESKLTVSSAEITVIREWIAEGAKWERHWAFIPPRKSNPPEVSDANWPRNIIDRHILARLDEEGLRPAPPADPAHLLRRVTFDLTGLPPTIAELDAVLSDSSDAAYERAVDRLLASPPFGERLAVEWLDVARYGDTDGLFEDHPRSIYPWRDWVVSAFNENLPYSDFIAWQLAGDLLPDASMAQKTATGFLRNNPTSNEGGIIDEDYRIKYLVDRVNTTATAFLGLTMECSQCHDHKFDPMTQREYYQYAGFFNSLVGKGNTKGATAPTVRILEPANEKRLGEIGSEIAEVEKALGETPPELTTDFEKWLADLERPMEWTNPKLVSDTRRDAKAKTTDKASKPSDVHAQFVRIESPKDRRGFITISEVEIFSGGRNIARAGTARQSSDYNGGSKAAKAIDGNASGIFASCSCTTEEKEPWWEVDLGGQKPIDHIVVYNRNDCCPERLDNVTVKLLDTDRKESAGRKIGDAPFRSEFTFNPDAPKVESKTDKYEIVLAPGPGKIAALGLAGGESSFVESLRLDAVASDGKKRELKLKGASKLKISETPTIVSLENPAEIAEGEELKLRIVGDDVQVRLTADETAATRTTLPKERDKRLAHFRQTWPGFEEQRKRLEALKKEKTRIEKSAKVSMVAADEGTMRTTTVLMRGEYDKPGEVVETAAPGSIMPYAAELPKNRLGLARWMIHPDNPLTARVAVNRYWQMIFGRGIVVTSEDFGTQGARPSHQALLDDLAVAFVESGWDLKWLIRTMVTSSTYRQASARTAAVAERDPENRLLSHAPRQRLAAEFVRDHALAVSGLLVNKRGGPGVHPYQPAELFGRNAIGAAGAKFTQGKGDDLYRRSLYTYWKRQIPAANMRILGADGRNACRTRRERTNTPLQALVLLNDPQFVEAARALAERVVREETAPDRRIALAFRLATSRKANGAEMGILVHEFGDRLREFTFEGVDAKQYLAGGGDRKPDSALKPAGLSELAAYAAVCSLILNLDESISKN